MKKIMFIVCAVLMLQQFSNAQIGKGSMLLSAGVSYYGNNYSSADTFSTNTNKYSNLSIAPGIGFFAANNLAIGAEVQYEQYSSSYKSVSLISNSSNSNTTTSKDIQFSPYAAYYIGISNKVYFSLTATFGYSLYLSYDVKNESQSGSSHTVDDNSNYENYALHGSLVPGVLFFLNQKWALQASMGGLVYDYSHRKDNDVSYDNYNNSTRTGLNLDMSSISFGVKYFLSRK